MKSDLVKAYKLIGKISKKMKPDLYYSVQIGMDSGKGDKVVQWAGYIEAPAQGLTPVTFAGNTSEEFITRLENFVKQDISEKDISIAFHEAQIRSNELSIDQHKTQLEELKNG